MSGAGEHVWTELRHGFCVCERCGAERQYRPKSRETVYRVARSVPWSTRRPGCRVVGQLELGLRQ